MGMHMIKLSPEKQNAIAKMYFEAGRSSKDVMKHFKISAMQLTTASNKYIVARMGVQKMHAGKEIKDEMQITEKCSYKDLLVLDLSDCVGFKN